ncbi:formylglycine-generating enzyme family protein [Demequina aestuarii]|uniref:formylglycine-generating enzyme family protein n=1 Tax=Demequina aestuarii TaxID=327095 RepID=UPI00078054FB|nr:SUMF1/EgtB/PvdO family nonheme iron enzyme [Demequina aestuarii]
MVTIPPGDVSLRDARRDRERMVVLESFEISAVPVSRRALAKREDHSALPAADVTWFEAVEWCNAASDAEGLVRAYSWRGSLVEWDPAADGYRLPTVAEWEYACRAASDGPTYGSLADIAWTARDDVDGPQPAALKEPNAWGLFDTLGNVWEWCWDYADPARYADYRTLKGGGWSDKEWACRVGVRRASAPDARIEDVGFRVARGGVSGIDGVFQGWSPQADHERADIRGALPLGWTPLRELARRALAQYEAYPQPSWQSQDS